MSYSNESSTVREKLIIDYFFTLVTLYRRIEKKDLIDPNNTRRYYYNNNWQVLCEYDGQDVYQRHFAYGNYIDEVLFMITTGPPTRKFYVHDHLHSPAALIDKDGNVVERYEYDAYGKVAIMDASYNSRSESLYGNPYTFQGKQLDLLDNGGLELMSWPYRSYSTHLGRWTQAEKLGMIPNDDQKINPFNILNQYKDGLNLYEGFVSNPLRNWDPHGLVIGGYIPSPYAHITAILKSVCRSYGCSEPHRCFSDASILARRYYACILSYERRHEDEYIRCTDYAMAIVNCDPAQGLRWFKLASGGTEMHWYRWPYMSHAYVGVFHLCNKQRVNSDVNFDPWRSSMWITSGTRSELGWTFF